ncbi:MAG: chemotaxis protein CheB [Sphingobium sp.]
MNAVPASHSSPPAPQPIRVLIVDDSVVVRTVIERILNQHPRFGAVHKTGSAEQALSYLDGAGVDLILLDIELPGQSGLAALPSILRSSPQAKVVILSGNIEAGSGPAIEALALGASDIMSKPNSGSFGARFPDALIDRLVRLFGGSEEEAAPISPPPRPQSAIARQPLACLGIGASTGGIHALGQLFAGLRAPLGVPVLVTQHLPASFTVYFAQQLGRMTSLPVRVAQTGDALRPDIVYVAPGDASLVCRPGLHGRNSITLDPARTAAGNLPGVDPMFTSMARTFGAGAAGIVLTGMGRDGTRGARDIVAAGGWLVAQDEASSVVWGMPGSVASAGLSSALLPPRAIMDFVAMRGRGGI